MVDARSGASVAVLQGRIDGDDATYSPDGKLLLIRSSFPGEETAEVVEVRGGASVAALGACGYARR